MTRFLETVRAAGRCKETLKYLLALALLFWLVRGGKMDLAELRIGLRAWPEMLAVMVLVYLSLGVATWRWALLLRTQGTPTKFPACFSLNMIGLVFGIFTAGGAGGDLARIYYVPGSGGATSVVLDRLLGLFSLVLLVTISAVWNSQTVLRNTRLATLCGVAVSGAAAGVVLMVSGAGHVSAWISKKSNRFIVLDRLRACTDALDANRRAPWTLTLAVLIGLVGHLLTCVAFFLIFHTISGASRNGIPVSDLLLTVPFALLASAIPVTPLGIGVGPAALFTMLQMVGERGNDGSSAFAFYQCVYLAVSLTGLIFYFHHKRPHAALVPA